MRSTEGEDRCGFFIIGGRWGDRCGVFIVGGRARDRGRLFIIGGRSQEKRGVIEGEKERSGVVEVSPQRGGVVKWHNRGRQSRRGREREKPFGQGFTNTRRNRRLRESRKAESSRKRKREAASSILIENNSDRWRSNPQTRSRRGRERIKRSHRGREWGNRVVEGEMDAFNDMCLTALLVPLN